MGKTKLCSNLLAAIDQFCLESGKTHTYVCFSAVNDGKFYNRLKTGGDCTTAVYERFIAWLEQHRMEATQ